MIIGTRGSELALKQTEIAIKKLKLKDYKIKVIKTKGDKIIKPLQKVGTGIFTKELDKALLNNKIDLAVHSLKDIPVENFNPKLELTIIGKREPRDCLIGNIFNGAIIGTDSIRRQYEIKNYYKNLKLDFKSIRGNIPTRINKLKKNEYDAIITAKAGLDRLNLYNKLTKKKVFSIKEMVPAAGQGAIAVVTRKDNFNFKKDKLYDYCILEREFIKDLGGCKKPVGTYCCYTKNKYHLTGLIYNKNKRILINFSGNKKIIKNKIKRWKAKYI